MNTKTVFRFKSLNRKIDKAYYFVWSDNKADVYRPLKPLKIPQENRHTYFDIFDQTMQWDFPILMVIHMCILYF